MNLAKRRAFPLTLLTLWVFAQGQQALLAAFSLRLEGSSRASQACWPFAYDMQGCRAQ